MTRGFTLVELLTVLAIVVVLAAVVIPATLDAGKRSQAATCAGKLRNLGGAVHLYCQDHGGAFPRSFHSAAPHREPGWAASIAPYLGAPVIKTPEEWKPVFHRLLRCPADTNSDAATYSYGLNVFFELDPAGDDYEGTPATWRCSAQVPTPARTILLGETKASSFGDHFMCHQWSGQAAVTNAVAFDRHQRKANFLFVDGHVERLAATETFTSERRNLWNPSLAGGN